MSDKELRLECLRIAIRPERDEVSAVKAAQTYAAFVLGEDGAAGQSAAPSQAKNQPGGAPSTTRRQS